MLGPGFWRAYLRTYINREGATLLGNAVPPEIWSHSSANKEKITTAIILKINTKLSDWKNVVKFLAD